MTQTLAILEGRPGPLARVDRALAGAAARQPFALPWSLGAGFAVAAYLWIFQVTGGPALFSNLASSLINVGTAYVLGFGVRELLARFVIGRAAVWQLLSHGAFAGGFTVLWYASTITLLGWRDGSLLEGMTAPAFRAPAFVWQMFQGLAVYAAAAALAQMAARRPATTPAELVAPPPPTLPAQRPQVLLVRDGDEIAAVEIDDIVLIVAADDYAEVVTAAGRHLARRSLGEFEAELPASFVRVHRSTLVNLNRLVRAEPAGAGRMTLHLAGGHSTVASRTGARLLRERAA